MFIQENSDKNVFIVRCSDWSFITRAQNHREASVQAIRGVLFEKGNKANLAYSLTCQSLKNKIEDEKTITFEVASILADAGFHKLASSLNYLNPHKKSTPPRSTSTNKSS
jgi:hypothetical protein